MKGQAMRARMSAASKKAWADPEVRARMSAARGLPAMTPEQARLYRKLRPLVGRDAALAEIFREIPS